MQIISINDLSKWREGIIKFVNNELDEIRNSIDNIKWGVRFVTPPRKHDNVDFSNDEINLTKLVANLRIHVERAFRRLKEFKILNSGEFSIHQADLASSIALVCALLSNYQNPLIGKDFYDENAEEEESDNEIVL